MDGDAKDPWHPQKDENPRSFLCSLQGLDRDGLFKPAAIIFGGFGSLWKPILTDPDG